MDLDSDKDIAVVQSQAFHVATCLISSMNE